MLLRHFPSNYSDDDVCLFGIIAVDIKWID